jgi:hypothetical protein
LGNKNELRGDRQFVTWNSAVEALNIKRVDYLKMDIEGSEWLVMPAILSAAKQEYLPRQISMEIHVDVGV